MFWFTPRVAVSRDVYQRLEAELGKGVPMDGDSDAARELPRILQTLIEGAVPKWTRPGTICEVDQIDFSFDPLDHFYTEAVIWYAVATGVHRAIATRIEHDLVEWVDGPCNLERFAYLGLPDDDAARM